MQPIRRMRQQVAVFMHGTALRWDLGPERGQRLLEPGSAVDDQKFRRLQATRDEVVKDRAPRGFALAAHVLDRKQDLLPVAPDPENHQQRDRGRLFVEPDPHHGAIEDQPDDVLPGERTCRPGFPVGLHPTPDAAHRVLRDRALEQRGERTLDPAGVGAGEIRARDQRLDLPGLPTVARQDGASPFAGAATLGLQPSTRQGELDRAERALQLAPTMPVTMTLRRGRGVRTIGWRVIRGGVPLVAAAAQCGGQFLLDHPFDEAPDLVTNAGFDRIEPGRPQEQVRVLSGRRAIGRHGVVSTGASTPVFAGCISRRLRRPPIPTTSATPPP
jgi:hypothetical protein